jgi:hypothetical protein
MRTAAAIMVTRRGLVYLPDAGHDADPGGREQAEPDPLTATGLILLEADLLVRGFLLSADLRRRL